MRLATVFALPVIMSFYGCAQMMAALAQGAGGGSSSGGSSSSSNSEEERYYNNASEGIAEAKAAGTPTDGDAWFKAATNWRGAAYFADSYVHKFCAEKKEDRCPEVETMQKESLDGALAFLAAGMQSATIEYNILYSAVLAFNESPSLYAKMPLEQWYKDLDGRKRAYWGDRLSKVGSFSEHVRRDGKGICYTSAKPMRADTKDPGTLQYTFSKDDLDIYVRCVTPEKISSYTRSAPDYIWIGAKLFWSQTEINLAVTVDVSETPGGNTWEFAIPTERLVNAIKKNYKEDEEAHAAWIRLRAAYIVPQKTGQKGVVGSDGNVYYNDTWNFFEAAESTFQFKFR